MGLREIKDRARRRLHKAMEVPAYYFDPVSKLPLSVTIRVHSKFAALGDVKGTSFGYAQRREEQARLVFLREQCEPKRFGVVIISREEGYRIDVLDPPDLITRTVFVETMTQGDISEYPSPDDGLPVYGPDMAYPSFSTAPETNAYPGFGADGELLLLIAVFGDDLAYPSIEA